MSADFGAHPELFTDLVEVLGRGRPGGLRDRAARLAGWPRTSGSPTRRSTARPRPGVRYQPKGVVGNIVPWNFPFDLSVGPLVEMLAAGNRVIIKPSDYTPACAELLRQMVSRDLPRGPGRGVGRRPDAGQGVPDAALGSPAVHRQPGDRPRGRARGRREPGPGHAGTRRQVPGHPGRRQRRRRERAQRHRHQADQERPDVHLGRLRAGAAGAARRLRRARRELRRRSELRGYASSGGLHRHHHRAAPGADRGAWSTRPGRPARGWSRSAATATRRPGGCRCVLVDRPARGPAHHAGRGLRPDPAGRALRRPRRGGSAASTRASARSGCTSTARTRRSAEDVLRQTTSGGACVNICALQGALPSLGFGGVGQSGSGRHHGIEGFREFSNPRGVVVRGTGDLADAFLPPYGPIDAGHRRQRVRRTGVGRRRPGASAGL